MRVVVFGGRSERELTRAVAGTSALDAGGRTVAALLAAALHACHIPVSNDTGPMHLAAAVGTPTVSIRGNECPRRSPGTMLPEAHRKCVSLMLVEDVPGAIRASVRT